MGFHFNMRGLLVAAPPMAVGYVIAKRFAVESVEPVAMAIGGPLVVAVDMGYRRISNLRLLEPTQGPSLFWVPAWLIGAVWMALGDMRLLRFSETSEIIVMIIAGVVALHCWAIGFRRWRDARRKLV